MDLANLVPARLLRALENPAARRLSAHPLALFIAVGALAFGLQALLRPAAGDQPLIQIPASRVAALEAALEASLGRPPSDQELESRLDDEVRQEVLFQEALALGLHRSDDMVRRRLLATMDWLAEAGVAADATPSEADLEALYERHKDSLAIPARHDVSHVFIAGPDESGRRRIEGLRQRIEAGEDPTTLGGPFARGRAFRGLDDEGLVALFGPNAPAALADLEVGAWSAPLASPLGWHLVRVDALTPARVPGPAEAYGTLVQIYRDQQQAAARLAMYEEIRARYRVVIEGRNNEDD